MAYQVLDVNFLFFSSLVLFFSLWSNLQAPRSLSAWGKLQPFLLNKLLILWNVKSLRTELNVSTQAFCQREKWSDVALRWTSYAGNFKLCFNSISAVRHLFIFVFQHCLRTTLRLLYLLFGLLYRLSFFWLLLWLDKLFISQSWRRWSD